MNLKLPNLEIKKLLGSPPRRYWNKLLVLFAIISVGVLVFDVWIFWRFFLLREARAPIVVTPKIGVVRKDILDKISARINQKEEATERFKEKVKVEDPS